VSTGGELRLLRFACIGACLMAVPFRGSIAQSQWDVSAAAVKMHYSSTEHGAKDAVLDTETGSLTGFEARFGWRTGRVGCALQVQQASGTLDYSGASQIGLPVFTTTTLNFHDDRLGCAFRLRPTGADTLDLGWDVGRRSIQRTINPSIFSSTLGEELTSDYAGIEIRATHRLSEHFRICAQAEVLRGLHDRLDVRFSGYADDTTLHVGGRVGDLGALGLQYSPVSWASISVAASREWQPYGASHPRSLYRQGVDIGFVEYPGSVQYWTSYTLSGNVYF
jgi:hypothetical protein